MGGLQFQNTNHNEPPKEKIIIKLHKIILCFSIRVSNAQLTNQAYSANLNE